MYILHIVRNVIVPLELQSYEFQLAIIMLCCMSIQNKKIERYAISYLKTWRSICAPLMVSCLMMVILVYNIELRNNSMRGILILIQS